MPFYNFDADIDESALDAPIIANGFVLSAGDLSRAVRQIFIEPGPDYVAFQMHDRDDDAVQQVNMTPKQAIILAMKLLTSALYLMEDTADK